jgi:hypothetical protein
MDAEQVFVQPTIDKVAIDLMREYNRGGLANIFNTYQVYLKATPGTLLHHLHQAKNEGFTIGVKLVRGAYINSEPRHLINDTKQDTDNAYDSIASGLLQRNYEDLSESNHAGFPTLELFLATHNKVSTLAAYEIQQARSKAGLPLTRIQYGQLLGMADEISCTLLQLSRYEGGDPKSSIAPQAFKCLSWATLGDCISYLLRRAVENRDAVTRTKTEYFALRKEVWRRLKGSVGAGTQYK